MKMEPIESSETSAIRTQTPGNYSKESTIHIKHGESLKSGILLYMPSALILKDFTFTMPYVYFLYIS